MNVSDLFKIRKDGYLKIIGVSLALSSIAGFFHFGLLYYISLAAFGLLLIFDYMKKSLAIDFTIIFFLLACLLSLIVNNPPSYFNAWARLGVYALVLFVVSPMISCKSGSIKRRNLLIYVMDVCVILSVLSFFCFFIGINLFVRKGNLLDIGTGTFSGLMNHSMVLGPISGLSTIYTMSLSLCETKRRRRFYYLAATICSFGSCMLSSSRIAVAATILGSMYLLYRSYRGNFSKYIKKLIVVVIISGLSFPLWEGLTDFLVQKQESNIELGGSMLYSREKKINARITEFTSSPIFGIGFATVDPSLDKVDFSDGQIEPGTSWLALFSMTGLFGFFAFVSICIMAFKRLKKIASYGDAFYSSLLGGMFVFYLIHLFAEGYIMAPRSFLNMLFWLILGAIYDEYKVSKKYYL